MCSATGDPVAEPPAHTGREISYPAIVPSLAVTGCSQLSRREFIMLVGGGAAVVFVSSRLSFPQGGRISRADEPNICKGRSPQC